MPEVTHYAPAVTTVSATIGADSALSDAVDVRGTTLVGLVMPADWTSADVTLQASVDGVSYADVYEASGVEVRLLADANRFIRLEPAAFAGMRYVKLRSGVSGAPVNQASARSLMFVVRGV